MNEDIGKKRRGGWVLPVSLILLGLTISGCGKTPEQKTTSENHITAAFAALSSPSSVQVGDELLLSREEAKRLVESCYSLARLDPERHDRICSPNPAVAYAKKLLRSESDGSSPVDRHFRDFHGPRPEHPEGPDHPTVGTQPGDTHPAEPGAEKPAPTPRVESPPAQPSSPTNDNSSGLEAEIRDLSLAYARSSAHRSIQRMLEIQAKVMVLHRDLAHALGNNAKALLPVEPLAILEESALKAARDGASSDHHRLEEIQALFPSPELKASVESIGAYIAKIDNIIQADMPGKFHRARDALANALDNEKWEATFGEREAKIAEETARLREEFKVSMPTEKWALWQPILPNPPPFDPQHPRSEGIAKALADYIVSPHEGLLAMARLESEFQILKNLPAEARTRLGIDGLSTEKWMAENLSDHHLNLSRAWFANLRDAAEGRLEIKDPGWDLGPDSTIREYLKHWHEVLSSEWSRRRAGGASGAELHPFQSGTPEAAVAADHAIATLDAVPSAAEKAAMVRLSVERYGREVAHMPPATQLLLKDFTKASLIDAFDRTAKLYATLMVLQRQGEFGTTPVSAAEAEALAKARVTLSEAAVQLDRVVFDRGKAGFYLANGERNKLNGMIRVLGDEPPPEEPSPSPRGPPEPPAGGPAGVMLCDPVFEAKFAEAKALVEGLLPSFRDRPTEPRNYGTDRGRMVASAADLDTNRFGFDKLKNEPDRQRLDEQYRDFRGRVDPKTKKPYPFEQVLELKTLAPVGGGIHMGGTASPAPGVDVKEFVLRYDASTKALALIGPKGETYRHGPIEPAVLKALLQFSRTEQNCAISIGWSGATELATSAKKEGQSVFLDPFFVDTLIGQDLFLADKVPWSLDKPEIAAGVPNPIRAEFERARAAFYDQQRDEVVKKRAAIAAYLEGVEPFGDTDTRRRLAGLGNERFVDIRIASLLESSTLNEAKAVFLRRIGVDDEADLDRRIAELRPLDSSPIAESLRTAKMICKSFDDTPSRCDALLPLIRYKVRVGLIDGKIPKDLIQMFYALQRAKTPDLKPDSFGAALLQLASQTTLAILIDDPTTFSIRDKSLVLTGGMRYRYVTQHLTVDDDGVRKVDPKDSSNEVRDLDELTSLANNALPKLTESYEPLRNVGEYARVAAFLRWATRDGNLKGLDFSGLATVATSDRGKTPTPDYVQFEIHK